MPRLHLSLIAASTAMLSGCFNMPTSPEHIMPSYVSGAKFKEYSCHELLTEMDAMTKRESSLISAQKQRIDNSMIQAFWTMFGQGDGMEAMELANLRGEKDAIQKIMHSKSCSH